MRRLIALALLLALCVPALALASHKDPKKQFTAADQRKAASIVLKRTDFRDGWRKTPSTPDDDQHLSCPGYDPDGSDLVLTGEAEADFARSGGFPAVFSFANVFKTRTQAAASWTRTVKPALPGCMARLFEQELEGGGTQVTITKSSRIAFPRVSPRTAAYRLSMTVSSGEGAKVPLTMYLVSLGHGRGEAGLMTMSLGGATPLAEVRVLAQVLAGRLAAAKL